MLKYRKIQIYNDPTHHVEYEIINTPIRIKYEPKNGWTVFYLGWDPADDYTIKVFLSSFKEALQEASKYLTRLWKKESTL